MRAGGSQPWPLELYRQCSFFQALPYDGGVLDQDGKLLELMETCVAAQRLSRKIDITKPAHREFYSWLFPKD